MNGRLPANYPELCDGPDGSEPISTAGLSIAE
jgi:hypothetical protein